MPYAFSRACAQSRKELAKLKAHRDAKAEQKPPHTPTVNTPAAKPKDEEAEESPSSLDEGATPAQRKIHGNLKQLLRTVDKQGQKLDEGFADTAEHHAEFKSHAAESNAEYQAAKDHRDKEEERFNQAQLADAEKELIEKAEKVKQLKENQAKEKRAKEEKEAADMQLKTSIQTELKATEVRQRSAMKSLNNDQTKLVMEGVDAKYAKGEDELDRAFNEGVDAGMEHEAKTEKERKGAAMAKRLGGSSKVLSMAANFENTMATNSTAPPPVPPPVPAAKPRRAARFANDKN